MKFFTKKMVFMAMSMFAMTSAHAQYISEAPANGFNFANGKDYIVIYTPEAQVTAMGSKVLSNQNLDPNRVDNQFYYWTADWDAKLFTLYDIEDTQNNSWGGTDKLNMTPLFDWGAGHFGAKAKAYNLSCVTEDHILHIGFMNIGSANAAKNFKFNFGPNTEIQLVVNKAVGQTVGKMVGVGNAPDLNKWYYLDIPIKDLLDEEGDFGFECDFSKPTSNIIFNAGFDGATVSTYTQGAVDPDTGMYSITITEKGSALAIDGVFLYKKDATGIKNITPALSHSEGACYNLSGQRVSNDYRGMVIKDGKKFLR